MQECESADRSLGLERQGDEEPVLPGCSHWEDRQVEEVGRLQREQEQRRGRTLLLGGRRGSK